MSGVRRLGDIGVLLELEDLEAVLRLDAAVRAARGRGDPAFAGVVDVVPAARTLTLTVPAGHDLTRLGEAGLALGTTAGAEPLEPAQQQRVEIAVRYDGPDLADVARLTGRSEEEVVETHTSMTWRAAFGGFAPGFFYLVAAHGDNPLRVARRDTPRTSVPGGSVGLAGEFSGVYPRSSPGGWQLIGRTEEKLWDVDRDPPALLRPGALVTFVSAA